MAALSLACGIVTIHFQWTRAMGEEVIEPSNQGVLAVLMRAAWSIGFDLRQIAWPDHLSMLYGNRGPHDGTAGPWLFLAGAGLLTAVAWLGKGTWAWARAWLAAFGSFLVLVVPVLGLVPMEYLKMAPVADHWLYLAMIPLAALAGSATDGSPRLPRAVIATGVLGLLGFLSHQRFEIMASPLSVWKSVLAQDAHSPGALRNLSVIHSQAGLSSDAIAFARRDVADHPGSLAARLNLCGVLANSGRQDEALELCKNITSSGKSSEAWVMQGNLLRNTGRPYEALEAYKTALSLSPRSPRALLGLGKAGYDLDSPQIMIPPLEELVSIQRGNIDAMTLLGVAYALTGQGEKARKIWQQALEISPNDQNLTENLKQLEKEYHP
jgi:tetratricopeptide (TPR) repeat protein